MNNKTKIGLMLLLASLTTGEVRAGDLTGYANGDVLLCFRNGGSYDMVVDAGPVSTFTNLAPNQRYTIATYTGSQLGQLSTNSLSWSAFTWLTDHTLYMTRARSSLNGQTSPWLDASAAVQGGTANRMATIVAGAQDAAIYSPESAYNSSTAEIEEDISTANPDYPTGVSYKEALFGAYGSDFNGTFQGNPENTTPSHFTTQGQVVRSDFYKLTPTSGYGQATFLGYFELNTNGVMTYVAYPTAAPSTPVLKSFSRSGNVTTITYTTGLSGTYTLRATSNLASGMNPTNWPALQVLSSGDTSVHSTTDTTTDSARFYTITAQ